MIIRQKRVIQTASLTFIYLHFFSLSAYGAIADIDIESEVLRSLGEFRFTIFTLLRVAKLRKYKAKIWYKPVKKQPQLSKSDDSETGSEPTTMEEPINFKEALEPESEIDEDSSEKEESVHDEGTESDKGKFTYL